MATLRASGLDEYSDAELVAATKSGETHAFEKLVFRYRRRVFAVAQRITNNRGTPKMWCKRAFTGLSFISTTFKKSRGSPIG
jgi:hypothetical protein